jgi:acid phosphatase (class A)
MGSAAVARLHADPSFRTEIDAARAELAAVRAKGLKPTRDCQAEAEALSQHLQSLNGEAKILQSWQGDYLLNHLDILPENQRQQSVGFIGDAKDSRKNKITV